MPPVPTRDIRCLHCDHAFGVARAAMVLTCPVCYKRIRVEDVVVNTARAMGRVETCGRVVVRRGGKVTASVVLASEAVEVLGEMQAGTVVAPVVYIGPKATWRGDLTAARIVVEPGAKVLGGRFRIVPGGLAPTG